jgi:ATP-binding cassette subfamily B (MDR/TAP) protein 1
VKLTTIRVVLGIVAAENLHLEQLDVKTAFLHGELEEDIYMQQPEGFAIQGKENQVCKLKKSLYSLKQAPRQWYQSQAPELAMMDESSEFRTKGGGPPITM